MNRCYCSRRTHLNKIHTKSLSEATNIYHKLYYVNQNLLKEGRGEMSGSQTSVIK